MPYSFLISSYLYLHILLYSLKDIFYMMVPPINENKSSKKHRLLNRSDTLIYSEFLIRRLYVRYYKSPVTNDNWNNNGFNVPNSVNFSLDVGVFLKLVTSFHLDIMVSRKRYIDREPFFLFNKSIWFHVLRKADWMSTSQKNSWKWSFPGLWRWNLSST